MNRLDLDRTDLHRMAVKRQSMDAALFVLIAPLPFFVKTSWVLLTMLFIAWLTLSLLVTRWMFGKQSANAKKAVFDYLVGYNRAPHHLAYIGTVICFAAWNISTTGHLLDALPVVFVGLAVGALCQTLWIALHPRVRD